MITKTTGVVLRATNVKEADRILEIYSDDLGKVRAIARGVRKIQSRMAGHLEPFTYVELMFAQGRGDLPTITAAKAREQFDSLRRDLDSVAAASYLAELVSRLTPEGQVSRRFPELLKQAFTLLDGGHDPQQVLAYFEWQAVAVAGWEPNLYRCVSCHQKLYPQGLSFSLMLSGVLCKECAVTDREAREISADAVKLLRCYAERPYAEVEGMLAGEKVRGETKRLTDLIVHYTLDREPRSKAFLAHMGMV